MPRLVSYAYVPQGFEMVLSDDQSLAQLAPGSQGGCWGLWFNVSLSDDPASWDDEVQRLNQLQKTLPPLTDEERLVRAQMAEFCRYHPLFPGSVDVLIGNVGAERLLDASSLGCEGRGLLLRLGVHDEEALRDQGRGAAQAASRALRRALRSETPASPLERRYGSLLEGLGEGHRKTVGWLADVLARGEPEPASFRELCAAQGVRARLGLDGLKGRPFNCLGCEEGSGQCCFTHQLDAVLLYMTYKRGEELRPWHRRFREEYILAYCDAVNSWLSDKRPTVPWGEVDAKYVSHAEAKDIVERTKASLGKKTPAKVWLAGCLLKTLKSNQRWHGGEELLDGFPMAASWLE